MTTKEKIIEFIKNNIDDVYEDIQIYWKRYAQLIVKNVHTLLFVLIVRNIYNDYTA